MSDLRALLRALRAQIGSVEPGVIWILVSAAALIVLVRSNGTVAAYNRHFGDLFAGHTWRAVLPSLYWFGCSLIAFLLLPLIVCRAALGLRWRQVGLGLGDWRLGLRLTLLLLAIMLPVVAAASLFPSFFNKYPLSGYVARQAVAWAEGGEGLLWVVLVYEAGYALYFLGWEFLFRGFLTVALARYIGPLAVFVQMVPFVILHVGKPQPEAFGAIVAGLALGFLALRTRSMWWGFFLHAAIALSMDLFAILARLAAVDSAGP